MFWSHLFLTAHAHYSKHTFENLNVTHQRHSPRSSFEDLGRHRLWRQVRAKRQESKRTNILVSFLDSILHVVNALCLQGHEGMSGDVEKREGVRMDTVYIIIK